MKLNPYPSFDGDCEEAFLFYEQHLGGKIETLVRYEGSPMATQGPPEWGRKIMHARIDIEGSLLMGSDAMPDRYQAPAGIQLSLDLTEGAKADQIFAALSEGGRVTMPLQKTFWAAKFGMVTDRFGIPWLINCEND